MRHLKDKKKLNVSSSHRKALVRNQVIQLITNGHITTTLTHAKEIRRLAERLVTLVAKGGNDFNVHRRVQSLLPYSASARTKLFAEIAPTYVNRAGGYTRILRLGRRPSDTASMARLQWV